ERMPKWFVQFIKYFAVGAVSAVVDVLIFQGIREFSDIESHLVLFGHSFEIEYSIAKMASFAIGTSINFALCVKFVFDLKGRSIIKASWRKLVSGLVTLGVSLVVLITLVEGLHLSEVTQLPLIPFDGIFLANCFSIGVGFFVNFVLTKYYAFSDY
ncbi:MAG: GtrA family protein, partial [Thermodesulfobacteriota bacterium]